MRLLNTKTFQVQEFYADIPPYAILSHTWDKEEVTFQDIQNLGTTEKKAGWSKVKSACTYAQKYEFEWIWIDSCCINKESSAELSEAINSMYQYYLDARVCYVYLSDVQEGEDPKDPNSAFRWSRWFTRGWTLQELLAPSYAVFFDKNWVEIGSKWSLRDVISVITTIPCPVFEGKDIDEYSIAQKMSWAAWRETTRPEDQAYCLMGIFGISMSPIYGEGGPKAFMRLQQEIIKMSDDRSIFAWIAPDKETEPRGLLARSPYEFRASGDVCMLESSIPVAKSSFSFNNNGLHIHISLEPIRSAEHDYIGARFLEDGLFLAPLHCQTQNDGKYLSIYLKSTNGGKYVRSYPSEVLLNTSFPSEWSSNWHDLVVKETQHLRTLSRTSHGLTSLEVVASPKLIHHGDLRPWGSQIHDFVYSTLENDIFSVAVLTNTYFAVTTDSTYVEEILPYTLHDNKSDYQIYLDWDRIHLKVQSDLVSLEQQGFYMDRTQTQLESGGKISLALYIAGTGGKLEVNYLPQENCRIPKPVADSPKLKFLFTHLPNMKVPVTTGLMEANVYPSSYFQVQYQDPGLKIPEYILIPEITDRANVPFYIFTLKMDCHYILIAAGIHESKLWTDVILLDKGEPPKVEEIWNSYLDGGSRQDIRQACWQLYSISREFKTFGTKHCLYVWTKDRKTLQFGSRFLHVSLMAQHQELPSKFLQSRYAPATKKSTPKRLRIPFI